jgi:putative phosphoribosyl transferase
MALYKDRKEAGKKLAEKLSRYKGREDVVVLGLPRGGVPVAYEVAKALNTPLDIFLVRKLGLPGHEELAMGAIASGGVHVLNEDVVVALDIPEKLIDKVAEREQKELERREKLYRGDRPPTQIKGKTAILIDDGLATGSSMRAAVEGLRAQGPQQIVVAVPIASPESCEALEEEVDNIICASTPTPFYGVGLWYQNFAQTTDEEVRLLLQEA